MSVITDTTTRRRLAALHAALLAKPDEIAAAQREVAELRAKARTLQGRIADQERQVPVTETDTADLAAALVDNPQAELDEASIEAAAHAQVQADRGKAERRARIAVLTRALNNLTPLIDTAEARVDVIKLEQEKAAKALEDASYHALLDEFRTRFIALHAPMLALEPAGGSRRHLSDDSLIQLRTWEPPKEGPEVGGLVLSQSARIGGWKEERLLSFDSHARERARLGADQAIDSFYASLGR